MARVWFCGSVCEIHERREPWKKGDDLRGGFCKVCTETKLRR